MLRNLSLLAWLITVASGLPGLARAQGTVPSAGGSVRALASEDQPGLAAPALFEVAQNDSSPGKSTNLADRLKAIRGNVTNEYSTSSRRTARGSVSPAAPAPVTDREVGADSAEPTSAPDLPSVLVRRGSTESAAPLSGTSAPSPTEPVDIKPQQQGLSDAFGTADQDTDSSRRTARRWRAPASSSSGSSALESTETGRSTAAGSGHRVSLTQQGPALRVEVDGPQALALGKDGTYHIRLVNDGPTAADRVTVTLSLSNGVSVGAAESRLGRVDEQTDPAGGRRIVWSLEQVTASSQQELSVRVKATENRPFEFHVDWAIRPATLSTQIEVQQPQLAVNVDGPVEMQFGDTRVFSVKLSNPGNGPAENVTVNIEATGANGQPNNIGSLAAGESRTLELELTAQQAGAMQIRALARGDGDLQAEAAHEVHVRRAALAVHVTAPSMLYAGSTATYQIRVANEGDAVAEGVIMQIELPTGATNSIGVDKKPITIEQPRWRIGDLSPGAEKAYSMQCDLTTGGPNQLVARIQTSQSQTTQSAAGDGLVVTDTAVTTVEAIADLKLVVNDPQGPVPLGTDVVYEIQVINRGSKEASNINVVAQFSEGIEPSAATGQRSEIVPGQVIFEPIPSIPAGGQMSLKVTARAGQSGNLLFRAELTCGDPETKLVAEESTRFYGSGNATPSAQRPTSEPTPARR